MLDPYETLNIPVTANSTEIKKAYRKMVLKYHPDKHIKNKSPKELEEIEEKFKNIYVAYEILSCPTKKAEYDKLKTKHEKIDFYDNFKKIIVKQFPKLNEFLKYLVKNIYNENEELLKIQLENFDFGNIYEMFSQNFHMLFKNLPDMPIESIESEKSEDYVREKDIIGKITVGFWDKFNNNSYKLIVNRETKEKIELKIPLYNNKVVFTGEGEYYNGQHGDIIIYIFIDPGQDTNYFEVNNNIYYNCKVPLYNYLYGGECKIKIIGVKNNCLKVNYPSLLEKNIIEIENLGMPMENNKRGQFVIIFTIENIEDPNKVIENWPKVF